MEQEKKDKIKAKLKQKKEQAENNSDTNDKKEFVKVENEQNSIQEKKQKKENEKNVQTEITISPEVVMQIVAVTMNEIEGVKLGASFFESIPDILKTKPKKTRGVRVNIKEGKAIIDIDLIVKYGIRIPDVAFEVQVIVKKNVETMTGLTVNEVNINVQGIDKE